MGGVSNTIKTGVTNTKKVLSGKGNLGDVANIALGNNTFNKPKDWKDTSDPNAPYAAIDQQSVEDQAAINQQGQSQYDQTLTGLSNVADANTKRAKDLFGQMLPNIAENAQAAHLYDSTGYGQEVGRQQAAIASEIANQEAQQRLGAMGNLQSYQKAALSRGMSLADFVNQAKVAKTLGAQIAPVQQSGKSGALAGAGTGAATGATIGSAFPGYGTAIGGLIGAAGGAYAGSQANGNRGK